TERKLVIILCLASLTAAKVFSLQQKEYRYNGFAVSERTPQNVSFQEVQASIFRIKTTSIKQPKSFKQ
ncbi:hypothetical protein HAX54_050947, partial [Datura stramonium]|nr:hypothetical protein [Datura stramonium]